MERKLLVMVFPSSSCLVFYFPLSIHHHLTVTTLGPQKRELLLDLSWPKCPLVWLKQGENVSKGWMFLENEQKRNTKTQNTFQRMDFSSLFLFLPNPVIQLCELTMWDPGIFSTSSRISVSPCDLQVWGWKHLFSTGSGREKGQRRRAWLRESDMRLAFEGKTKTIYTNTSPGDSDAPPFYIPNYGLCSTVSLGLAHAALKSCGGEGSSLKGFFPDSSSRFTDPLHWLSGEFLCFSWRDSPVGLSSWQK